MIELDKKMEDELNSKKILEKIKDVMNRYEIIRRKDLAKELKVLPRNLNRDIDKLIIDKFLTKDKEGREIIYIKVPNEITVIEEPKLPKPLKIQEKTRVTKADELYAIIESEDRWFSHKELREKVGLTWNDFARAMRPNILKGKVEEQQRGREKFYKKAGTSPIREVQELTNLEIYVNRIEPLKAFLDYMLHIKHCSQRTHDKYARNIVQFYQWKDNFNMQRFQVYPVERFTQRDVDNFLKWADEEKHYADETIKGLFIALKSYFKFLKKRNYILDDFMADEEPPPVTPGPQVMVSFEEFWQLVTVAVNGNHPTRDLTLLLVMLETGARVGEIETICREDVNFNENILTIHGEKSKKVRGQRKDRTMPISELTTRYLRATIAENADISTPVYVTIQNKREKMGTAIFLNRKKSYLRNRQIRNVLKVLRETAHLENAVTVHSFRRRVMLHLTNSDMRPDFVALRVGHVPANKMLVDYIKLMPEYRQKYDQQYQRAHPLNQPEFVAKFDGIVKICPFLRWIS